MDRQDAPYRQYNACQIKKTALQVRQRDIFRNVIRTDALKISAGQGMHERGFVIMCFLFVFVKFYKSCGLLAEKRRRGFANGVFACDAVFYAYAERLFPGICRASVFL